MSAYLRNFENNSSKETCCNGEEKKSRGFVTIATGKEVYYKIAANLLLSYRYHSADPYPFAIICDRTNKYTDLFDKVVIIDKPRCSFVDKLRLPEYLPFDETIFIDADCLAYKDLNDYWEAFEGADVFSVFGGVFRLDHQNGWFKREDVGQYGDKIKYIPDFYGGVYYLRKSEELKEFYETVKEIEATYRNYKFRYFPYVADEPVYALAMAVHDFRPKKTPDICFLPHTTYFESNIETGTVKYISTVFAQRGLIPEAYMVHWGSDYIWDCPYRLEEYRLKRICNGKPVRPAGLKTAEFMIKTSIPARRLLHGTKQILRPIVRKFF